VAPRLLDLMLNENHTKCSGGTTDEAFHCTLDDGDCRIRIDRTAGRRVRSGDATDATVTDVTGADHTRTDFYSGTDIV
jgi:hypothetical protein